mgnify:FL=1
MANKAHTIKQARLELGNISQGLIYALIKQKQLKTFRVGGRRLVSDEALTEFIRNQENIQAASEVEQVA